MGAGEIVDSSVRGRVSGGRFPVKKGVDAVIRTRAKWRQ